MKTSTANRVEHQIDAAIFTLQKIEERTAGLGDYARDNTIRRMTLDAYRYIEFAQWLILRDEQGDV